MALRRQVAPCFWWLEGLLMYLGEADVKRLVAPIARSISGLPADRRCFQPVDGALGDSPPVAQANRREHWLRIHDPHDNRELGTRHSSPGGRGLYPGPGFGSAQFRLSLGVQDGGVFQYGSTSASHRVLPIVNLAVFCKALIAVTEAMAVNKGGKMTTDTIKTNSSTVKSAVSRAGSCAKQWARLWLA